MPGFVLRWSDYGRFENSRFVDSWRRLGRKAGRDQPYWTAIGKSSRLNDRNPGRAHPENGLRARIGARFTQYIRRRKGPGLVVILEARRTHRVTTYVSSSMLQLAAMSPAVAPLEKPRGPLLKRIDSGMRPISDKARCEPHPQR